MTLVTFVASLGFVNCTDPAPSDPPSAASDAEVRQRDYGGTPDQGQVELDGVDESDAAAIDVSAEVRPGADARVAMPDFSESDSGGIGPGEDAASDGTAPEDESVAGEDIPIATDIRVAEVHIEESDLDSDLAVPASTNETCENPRGNFDCPGFPSQACRFFSSESSRCEPVTTANLGGDFCNGSDECDVGLACFRGTCTLICTPGFSECGVVEWCLDIGHPEWGVCDPAELY
ncbi:MAG: hypothetical protein KC561_01070 [Myxococcales bacterium]|nr:hypothetical protein [Myxococcales bacterium]